MREHTTIAVLHDTDELVAIGYGTDYESAFIDLMAVMDDESLDIRLVTFYCKAPAQIKWSIV